MILKLGLVIDVALKVLHLNMHRHKTYKRPAWPCNVLAQKLQLLCRNICSFVCYFCYLTRYPAMLLFSCALSLMLNMQIKIPIQYNIVNTCSFYVDIHTIYIFIYISFLRIPRMAWHSKWTTPCLLTSEIKSLLLDSSI